MILSEIDIKEAFYGLVSSSKLSQIISGSVYRDKRPINSTVEDIVISVLTSGAGQIQPFILNVNIYFPDIKRGKEFICHDARASVLMREGICLFEQGVASISVEDASNKEYGIKYRLESQKLYEIKGANFHAINHKISIEVCTE